MRPSPETQRRRKSHADDPDEADNLTPEQRADLEDQEKQQMLWRAFHLQMKRRACPGCGDDELF